MIRKQPQTPTGEIEGSSLDVLVVAYQSEATLPALLESVRESLPQGSRVAIWSNSDPVPLRDLIGKEIDSHPEQVIELLGNGENLGFARSCNSLAEWSDRENLLFLNPDALVVNWPRGLSLAPRSIKAPVVLDSDSVYQESYGQGRTLSDEFAIRVLRRKSIFPCDDDPFAVGFVSGAAFLVGRRDFLRVGGFDEKYFMYYEDIDLGRRWAEAGATIWVDPNWSIKHIGGASSKSDRLSALQRSHLSAERFHKKWSDGVRLFRAICTLEAILKSIIALFAGRVGRVSRGTQLTYTKWLLRRWWETV